MTNLLLLIFLFLISILPECVKISLNFQLRPLIFAVFVSLLIFQFRLQICRPYIFSTKKNLQFRMINIAYAICVFCIVVSLILSENIKAFHNSIVFIMMFFVYIFCNSQINKYKNNKKFKSYLATFKNVELMCLVILFIGFANALFGMFQFFCGKEVIGTFGYSSFFGCFLAMNVPLAFCLVLELWKKKSFSYRFFVIGKKNPFDQFHNS